MTARESLLVDGFRNPDDPACDGSITCSALIHKGLCMRPGLGEYLARLRLEAHGRIAHAGGGGMGVNPHLVLHLLNLRRDIMHARELIGSGLAQEQMERGTVNQDFATVYDLLNIPGSAETATWGDSVTAEACTDSAQNLAEWIYATIDYLVLDGPLPATLDEYVSKPTLARKAKDKVRELARRAE